MEIYLTGSGQVLQVHDRLDCLGIACVIHSPMPGPWETWPTHWRSDWGGFMERICPCGVGHPVVEDLFVNPTHGCCGVCVCTVEGP